MDLTLLTAPHTFKEGNVVLVTDKINKNDSFNGVIYRIINAPANKHLAPYNSIYVDHFYIKFSNEDYNKLLSRGLDIIHNHKPEILGKVVKSHGSCNITEVYTQTFSPGYYNETKIDINDINAILVWRTGFDIR
jgi:hypothetical protein